MLNNLRMLIISIQPYITLFTGAIAFLITIRAFWLTVGNKMRVGYCTRRDIVERNSLQSSEVYIDELIIENLKNKTITILGIYLKLGSQYFLSIRNFEKEPLILKGYDTTIIRQDTVVFYSCGMTKVLDIGDVLRNSKIKKEIVFLTTNGLIKARSKIIIKDHPITQMLQNPFIAVITPRFPNERQDYYEQSISVLPMKNKFIVKYIGRLIGFTRDCYIYLVNRFASVKQK